MAGPAALMLAGALVLSACGHGAPRSTAVRSRSSRSTASAPSTTHSAPSASSPSTASCVTDSTPSAAGEVAPGAAAVELVSGSTGWVAGAGRILATTDGGVHWTVQLTTAADFGEVDFLSTSTGWAVAAHELLVTTDGGQCWQKLAEPSLGDLRMVHFVSDTTGFGVAGGTIVLDPASASANADEGFSGPFAPVDPRTGGVLVETTDGGHRWSPVPTAPRNAQSVCFVDATTGWLGAGGGLYRSVDGGRQWSEVADPGASSGAAPDGNDIARVGCGAPDQVWVASDTGGVAAGTSPWAVFASTSGTGARLLQADMYPGAVPAPPGTPGSYPGPISVIGAGLAAVGGFTPAATVGQMARVEVLDANGQVLSPARGVAGLAEPVGLAFLSASEGWVVGVATSHGNPDFEAGVIERTTDGGQTWTVQRRIGP